MTRRVQTVITVTCDACNTEVDSAQSFTFGWKATAYEIDLCDQHAQEIENSIAPWIGYGRRSEVRNTSPRQSRRTPKSATRDLRAVRDWAKNNGFKLGDRGRIPRDVIAAYEKQTA